METKTLNELFDEYYSIAKKLFEFNNIKISKTGVLGYLLYILGYIQKDSHDYYNYLVRELYPLTAQEYSSLLLHASLFGYLPEFAHPATYKGNIKINLPKLNNNIEERNIIIQKGTKFNINNTIWTLDAEITINRTHTSNYAVYSTDEGYFTQPITVTDNKYNTELETIILPLQYLHQYKEEIIEFTMPNYEYGIYYKYQLKIPKDNFLANLKVFIKFPNEKNYEEYKVVFSKVGISPSSKCVFLSQIDSSTYVIEFGNGINGIHIPENAEVKIFAYYTQGSRANFLNGTLVLLDELVVNDKYIDGHVENYIIDKNLVTGEITESITDGKDSPTIEELRTKILSYIQTKNYLVTYDDYNNIFKNLFNSSILFKKINFVDNDVYIYTILHNSYFYPYKTITLTLEESVFNPNDMKFIFYPEHTYVKQKKIPYPFENEVYVVEEVNNSANVKLNDVSQLTNGQEIVFNNDITTIYTVQNIDTSNNIITVDKTIEYLPVNTTVQYAANEKITLISPFLYRKDEIYNCYFGYMVNNNEIVPEITSIYNSTKKIPNITFQINISNNLDTITFTIKSYANQDLSNNTFSLTIEELNITNEILDQSNNYTYILNIPDDNAKVDIFKKLLKNIHIKIYVMDLYGNPIALLTKDNFQYITDISDLLMLKYFIYNGTKYALQIPFISKDEYYTDKNKIDEKLYVYFVNTNIADNRLISVHHSMRFFNTIELSYPLDKYLADYPSNTTAYIDLPLRLKLYIKFDKHKVNYDGISIDTLIEQIKYNISKLLDSKYTGNNIEFYESKIVDEIHNNPYVKYVEVLEPKGNIVVKKFNDYLKSISDNKLKIAEFCPVYFWWDVNNIEILYDLE